MKKLIIGLALSAISTGALASKARLESLGETGFGSQFIDDSLPVKKGEYLKLIRTLLWV